MKYKGRYVDATGMSLVEFMVAIAITSIVMAVSLPIFTSQFESYRAGKETKDIQETNQSGIEILRRDLAVAGWSVMPQMAFYIEDGDNSTSDKIYVTDSRVVGLDTPDLSLFVQNYCAGCASMESGGGTATVTASQLDIDDDNSSNFIGGEWQFVISDLLEDLNATPNLFKVARISSVDSGTRQLSLVDSEGDDRNLGGTWLAPAIYYCVDDGADDACHPSGNTDQWILRRSDRSSGGRQPLAPNVVDLQVAYRAENNWYGEGGCDGSGRGSNFCSLRPFDPSLIDLIRITMVTRSESRVGASNMDPRYCRPQVENRPAADPGSDECGYMYRTYTTTVQPRNAAL